MLANLIKLIGPMLPFGKGAAPAAPAAAGFAALLEGGAPAEAGGLSDIAVATPVSELPVTAAPTAVSATSRRTVADIPSGPAPAPDEARAVSPEKGQGRGVSPGAPIAEANRPIQATGVTPHADPAPSLAAPAIASSPANIPPADAPATPTAAVVTTAPQPVPVAVATEIADSDPAVPAAADAPTAEAAPRASSRADLQPASTPPLADVEAKPASSTPPVGHPKATHARATPAIMTTDALPPVHLVPVSDSADPPPAAADDEDRDEPDSDAVVVDITLAPIPVGMPAAPIAAPTHRTPPEQKGLTVAITATAGTPAALQSTIEQAFVPDTALAPAPSRRGGGRPSAGVEAPATPSVTASADPVALPLEDAPPAATVRATPGPNPRPNSARITDATETPVAMASASVSASTEPAEAAPPSVAAPSEATSARNRAAPAKAAVAPAQKPIKAVSAEPAATPAMAVSAEATSSPARKSRASAAAVQTADAAPGVSEPVRRALSLLRVAERSDTLHVVTRRAAPSDASSADGPAQIFQIPANAGQPAPGPTTPATASIAAPPTPAAALADRIVDIGVSGQWIDRLAQEIATVAAHDGTARFALNPQSLGAMQVEIRHTDAGAAIRMLVETDAALNAIKDAQPQLKADANLAAIRIADIQVERRALPAEASSTARDQSQQQAAQSGKDQTWAGSQQQATTNPGGTSTGPGGQTAGQPYRKAPLIEAALNGPPGGQTTAEETGIAARRARARYA